MKKKPILLLFATVILLMNGALWYYFSGEESGITQEEAATIALEQSESDGLASPTLWDRFDHEIALVFQYSVERDESVRAWKVEIDTEDHANTEHMPAAVYYVGKEEGDIIQTIHGNE